jgi:proteasome alpha subunit
MIEEPYRWVEAVQNRREYIEHQIASGSPIAAISCAEGVLLATVGRERQKIYEVYDRIALGAIGHPGDIERLRIAAIEVTSSEGFSRSAQDVSLRRLASYSLSPLLKKAFEEIFAAPYLARLLLVEVGRQNEPDLFVKLDYDGAFTTNGGWLSTECEPFAVISGKSRATALMEKFLRSKNPASFSQLKFSEALPLALKAWAVGHMALTSGSSEEAGELPSAEEIAAHKDEQLKHAAVEAATLERTTKTNVTYKTYPPAPRRNADAEAETMLV